MDNKRKRKISPEQARHNEEIEILNNYLSQRRKAKRRKTILEKRLMDIREDMKHPISAVGYSPINAPTNEIGEGAASFTFRTSEALELYYIDGLTWENVAEKMEVSRSQAYNLRRAGLEKLLTFKRVKEILRKYEAGEIDK